MKLLKINIQGLALFDKELNIDFLSKKSESSDDYTNKNINFDFFNTHNVIALIGKNSSGKSLTLKAIFFVLEMLSGKDINLIKYNNILVHANTSVNIVSYFYKGNTVYKLQTTIQKDLEKYFITNEILWSKVLSDDTNHLNVLQFNETNFVKSDNTLFGGTTSIPKYQLFNPSDITEAINLSTSLQVTSISKSILNLLDPNIQSIVTKNNEYVLQYKNNKTIITDNILDYLSSGTVRGINLFARAISTLQKGGYLIVDDLENNLSAPIIRVLLHLFLDLESNKNGATLIFSTNHASLLTDLEDDNAIYTTTSNGSIVVEPIASLLQKQHDNSNQHFINNELFKTSMDYDDYLVFYRQLCKYINSPDFEDPFL